MINIPIEALKELSNEFIQFTLLMKEGKALCCYRNKIYLISLCNIPFVIEKDKELKDRYSYNGTSSCWTRIITSNYTSSLFNTHKALTNEYVWNEIKQVMCKEDI